LPIGSTPQTSLTEESLTAYEIAYTGTLNNRTTVGAAFYINDLNHSINFTQLPTTLDPYTAANPPPGWPLPPSILTVLASQGVFLPRTAFTYLNLGPLRQERARALGRSPREQVVDGVWRITSWQGDPKILDDRIRIRRRSSTCRQRTGSISASTTTERGCWAARDQLSDRAFWADVLTTPYFGFTDSYTM